MAAWRCALVQSPCQFALLDRIADRLILLLIFIAGTMCDDRQREEWTDTKHTYRSNNSTLHATNTTDLRASNVGEAKL